MSGMAGKGRGGDHWGNGTAPWNTGSLFVGPLVPGQWAADHSVMSCLGNAWVRSADSLLRLYWLDRHGCVGDMAHPVVSSPPPCPAPPQGRQSPAIPWGGVLPHTESALQNERTQHKKRSKGCQCTETYSLTGFL